MTSFDYTFNIPTNGILSSDELHFFYYDVMRNTEAGIQTIYEWNGEINTFLNEKGIKVENMEKGSLPQSVDKDKIYFSVLENETMPLAFFRHLRNAFAHHRIVRCCEYLHLEDVQGKNLTMKGLVKFQDLKELCFLFFNQRTKFENMNNI